MGPRLAEGAELDPIRAIAAEFRDHWERHRPPWPCAFDGAATDLSALGWLDYEIGLPPSGEWGAAIVWGGVLAANSPLRWHLDDDMGSVLRTVEDGPFLVWPYARVLESQWAGRGLRFKRLFEEAVFDLIRSGLLGEADERRLLDLARAEAGPSAFLREIDAAADRLRGYLGREARRDDRERSRRRKGRP